MPIKMPVATTAAISTAWLFANWAITAMSAANSVRLTYRVGAMPNLACSRGAENTAQIATSTPQLVKAMPSW